MATNRTYDGIIIGAGHNGMILGTYLARQGLNILIVDRNLKYGGGLMTEEVTLPNFQHNLHSINHWDITNTPWYRDFNLAAKVDYLTPRYEFAQPHKDGTALVIARDLEETVHSISRISKKDAQTFREWASRSKKITRDIFLVERFSEPLSPEEREEVLMASEVGRDYHSMLKARPLEIIDSLFESEKVKVLLLFKLSIFGTVLYDMISEPSPSGAIFRAFDIDVGYQLCKGGSWNLARGLMESYIAAGGAYINQAQAERIIVDGNRATGVELADGRVFEARQFVASTLDVHKTFQDMVGFDQLPAQTIDKVNTHRYTTWSLFGVHLALKEAPAYSSAAWDPNVNDGYKVNIGSETLEQLMTAHQAVAANRMPSQIQFGGGAITTLDPTQAPKGAHTAYAWHVMPFEPDGKALTESEKADFTQRLIAKWREYAPNLTDDNILGTYTYTPDVYVQHLPNMRYGDINMGAFTPNQVLFNHFGYRTPIDGLYVAGSAAHPGGGIAGGVGYISAGIIADDLGIKPWWQPVKARERLLALAEQGK